MPISPPSISQRLSILVSLLMLTLSFSAKAADNGDIHQYDNGSMVVWNAHKSAWLTPEGFFAAELERLNGPTYGAVKEYPPYESVKEWESLIDMLPDGRVCPMVFFHQRWRRLPDVLALDERLRNYGGCRDVFKH